MLLSLLVFILLFAFVFKYEFKFVIVFIFVLTFVLVFIIFEFPSTIFPNSEISAFEFIIVDFFLDLFEDKLFLMISDSILFNFLFVNVFWL